MRKKRRLFSKAQVRRLYRLIDQGREEEIDWSDICDCYTLTTSFVREFREYLDWVYITACHKHTKNFIREFADEVEKFELSGSYHHIGLDFIEEIGGKENHFLNLLCSRVLKEKDLDKGLEKYKLILDPTLWRNLSIRRAFSEPFMEKWQDYLDWNEISFGQILNESFIEKHFDKFNLYQICMWQKLSDDFIIKHEKDFDKYGKYCWKALQENRMVSKKIKEELVARKYDIAVGL